MIKLNYDYHKDNKTFTLIFLHGLGGNLYAWNKIRDQLHNKNYSTIGIDLRGHGNSERPKKLDDYKLELFADDIHKIIKKEEINKFILVGHCFGGVVSAIYQDKFKDAAGTIFIGTTDRSPKRLKLLHPIMYIINNFLLNFLSDKNYCDRKHFDNFINTSDFDIKRIFSDIANTSPKSYSATFYQFSKYNGEKILPNINIPVLIIYGQKDRVFYTKYARRLHKLINNSKLVEIPQANHILIISQPKKVAKEIDKFCSNIVNN